MLDMKRITELINSLGYKTYTFDTSVYMSYIWGCYEWYKGKVPGFHSSKRYNGATNVVTEKAKLYMAKRICEDLASLVCNENMIINIEDKAERDFILGNDDMSGILGQNDFWSQFNKCYELTAGLGTGAIEIILENLLQVDDKLVANKNTKIKLARYDALHILPLSWENSGGTITEVAFIDEYRIGNDAFLELRLHVKDEKGNYVIVNRKCKVLNTTKNEGTLNNFVFLDDDSVVSEFNTGSPLPLFTVLKMPQINSYAIDGPMGSSCYGDAIDVLKAVDNAFDTLCGDFFFGKKRVYYNRNLLEIDPRTGKAIIPDDDEYIKNIYFFTGSSTDGNSLANDKEPIKEENFKIRSEELTKGINLVLDILSFKCGLGKGYYKFTSDGVQKTATEVISQNSDLYRNICKMQLAIENNIYDIVRGLLYISNYVFGTTYNVNCKMSVDFDASITEDKTLERERCLKEVELGLLTVDEYRAMYYPELGDKQEVDLTKDV